MKVIKRKGNEEEYNSKKVYKNIVRAMKAGSGVYYPKIAQIIVEDADTKFSKKETIKSEDIDKFVLNKLNDYGQNLTANAYERYKTLKAYQSQKSAIDNDICGIIDGSNKKVTAENANKDARMISTQRDLIAGTESRSYSERKIMPTYLLNAHKEGLIHIHDTDYMINAGMFNCFSRSTSFITSNGLKSFEDFNDGDEILVPTHLGNWKKATVHCYGKQDVYKYRISRNSRIGCGIEVIATKNHKWFNENGERQEGINVGDRLLTVNYLKNFNFDEVDDHLKKMWCYGFILGDGSTTESKYIYTHGLGKRPKSDSGKMWRTKVRLCGHKMDYVNRFETVGYSTYGKDEYLYVEILDFNKNTFLTEKQYLNLNKEEAVALFNGLLCADGHLTRDKKTFRGISSSNPFIIEIIKLYSDLSGWFITNVFIDEDDTNYGKRNYPLYTFGFSCYEPVKYTTKNGVEVTQSKPLKVISEEYVGEEDVWCLNVEDDHSFILEGGIPTSNCCLWNLKDMLDNGTVINGKMIEKPKSLRTAATVATQIALSVASGQYGGQTFSISHLAPYVRISYEKLLAKYTKELNGKVSDDEIKELAYSSLKDEVKDSVQIISYQINTFNSSNGQTPFCSVFLYLNEDKEYVKETAMLIEEVLKQRILGIKNEYGVYVTPAFPKLLYVLDENNVPNGSEYRYLTDLAVKCSSLRMNPDYISAKIMRERYDGNVFPCMGCRSFLSNYKDEDGNYKFYGRFNRGVVTLNLVDVALSSQGDMEKFWNILDERLELCKDALILRDSLLRGASANVSPIHWRYGALARLGENDTIDKYLHNGYSTISLGYIGVYEMTKYMTGESHTQENGKEFALSVMQHLNDKAKYWKENVDGLEGCSVYGTPSESLTFKFSRTLKKRFGEICGITDKNWQTNSYHINVMEEINAFDKLTVESEFQKLSMGGCVSYVELPDMTKNLEALSQIVEHMYNTMQYAEINLTGGDYCGECGYVGEMKIVDGKWTCPHCGSTDTNKMSISRRVCGYINASPEINAGKMDEFNNRVKHL